MCRSARSNSGSDPPTKSKASHSHHQHHQRRPSPSLYPSSESSAKRKKSKKKRKRSERDRAPLPSSSDDEDITSGTRPPSAVRKEARVLDRSVSHQERSEKKPRLERSLSSSLGIAYTYGLSNDCKPASSQPMRIPKINKVRPETDAS